MSREIGKWQDAVPTGYISLSGERILDGLKRPPIAFQETDDSLILRWISGKSLYEVEREVEMVIPKEKALDTKLDIMKTGILAYEKFYEYVSGLRRSHSVDY